MAVDHSGHRDRMRQRAVKEGLENFQPHEFLELLLYPFIPYRDTNPIAHELLDEFGSLEAVFEADADSLMQVKGMTNGAAFYFSLMPQIFRKYSTSKLEKRPTMDTTDKLVKYLNPFLATLKREAVYMMCLDAKYTMLSIKCIGNGVVNQAILHIRDIVEEALKRNATSVVIAHNHPGGTNSPSQQDIVMTEDVYTALSSIGVELMDHIIISPTGHYSFRKHGGFDLLFRDDYNVEPDKPKLYKNGGYDELFDLSQLDIDYGDGYIDEDED